MELNELRETIYKYALQNAVKHNGKAETGPVMSKIIAERPELRSNAREIVKIIKEIIEQVNSLTLEQQLTEIKAKYPELLEEKKHEEKRKVLPPLPNVKGQVVTRFAPNPDGPLHLGNARSAILSYEYAKMYNGKFILRFDDTDPKVKRPILDAYDWIKEDLKWLGIKWEQELYASERLELYYKYARYLIEKGYAYVDTCDSSIFRKFRDSRGKMKEPECLHRSSSPESNLELFEKMLGGKFKEGEAVVRLKTDLSDPDPSQIDWVMLRIIDTAKNPHPRVGSKYWVWPTYNFASIIDDHELGITHVLRAKEHMSNTEKQRYISEYMGWEFPEVLQFGRLRLEGFMMSKSKIRGMLEKGTNRDDPRLPTLAGLRRRGILPDTIKDVIIDVGVKVTDATISFENIAAINRKKLDPVAKRIMFVKDAEEFSVELPESLNAKIPLIPSKQEMNRTIIVNPGDKILIESNDAEDNSILRLMELCNVKVDKHNRKLIFHSKTLDEAKKVNAKIVQWVKSNEKVPVMVEKAERDEIKMINGYAEKIAADLEIDEIVQFYRFGFVRVDRKDENMLRVVFSHD
ncbi:glutamate--tRNA ligase [Saccharolobus solfataricus]|nr:glutamate--tRNA ligase [Saccharolobus solfataricus]AKA73435.1 glutamate--tRNA ligase [Saccharolobus solfataricus]AKA76133.1 glutamate--tRNA ligase [Saccharolobus solfataricus]AKA78825.1 glutamate--tRNA ligase [Saccharolobus solfataricus]AZF67900.1 glutamate--tRNA ligase [Saccharolobus solfataricus]AZF70520.1 glutamate--tRNA ligase [Saccharolobus solfataricus]